jgi:hypothetical protein
LWNLSIESSIAKTLYKRKMVKLPMAFSMKNTRTKLSKMFKLTEKATTYLILMPISVLKAEAFPKTFSFLKQFCRTY